MKTNKSTLWIALTLLALSMCYLWVIASNNYASSLIVDISNNNRKRIDSSNISNKNNPDDQSLKKIANINGTLIEFYSETLTEGWYLRLFFLSLFYILFVYDKKNSISNFVFVIITVCAFFILLYSDYIRAGGDGL